MKRPIAVVGFSYTSALALSVFMGAKVGLWLCTLFFVLTIVTLIIKPLRKTYFYPTVFFTAFIGVVVYLLICNNSVANMADEIDGKEVDVVARITDKNTSSGSYYSYEAHSPVKFSDGIYRDVNFVLYTYTPLNVDYYDLIECTVTFSKITNPNIKLYYESKNISFTANIKDEYKIKPQTNKGFNYYAKTFRNDIRNKIFRLLPNKQASFLATILLGDRRGLDENIIDDFKVTSTYHLLVVSGLHTSVIGMVLYNFLKFITKKKLKLSAFITTLGLIFYAFLMGLYPSVMRAVIMVIVILWSHSFREQADIFTSLGLAMLIITVNNPLIVGNYGFLLTFLNVTGIAIGATKMTDYFMARINVNEHIAPFVRSIVKCACATICASIAIFPVSVLVFEYVSPYIILSNLTLIPLTELLVTIGFIMVFMLFIPPIGFVGKGISLIAGILVNVIVDIVNFFADLPAASVYISSSFYAVWLGVCFIIIGIALLFTKTVYGKSVVAMLCLIILIFFSAMNTAVYKDKTVIDIIDSGSGVTAVVRKNNNASVFCCGGNKGSYDNLTDKLYEHTNNISLIVLTKYDKYTPKLINEFNVENVLLYDTDKLSEEVCRSIPFAESVTFADEDKIIKLWDDITVEIVDIKNGIWVYITTENTEYLICPQNGDCSTLPENMRTPGSVIISDVPKNFGLIMCSNVIVSGSDDDKLAASLYFDDTLINCTYVDNECITIFDKKREIYNVQIK